MKVAFISETRRLNARRINDVDDRGTLGLAGKQLTFQGRRNELDMTVEDVRIVPTAFAWGRAPIAFAALVFMWVLIFAWLSIRGDFNWPPGQQEALALWMALAMSAVAGPAGIAIGYNLTKSRRRIIQVDGADAGGKQITVNFSQGSIPGTTPELVHALERARVA